MFNTHLLTLFMLISLSISGCGGGGGSGEPLTPATGSTVTVTYSKGPVTGATAHLLDASGNIVAGAVSTVNGQALFINVTYVGVVYARFSGGRYTDEATGVTVNLASSFEIRSGVKENTGSSDISLVASPLTEIGFRQAIAASGGINLATINTRIAEVADEYGLDNIDLSSIVPTPLANITGNSDADRYGVVLAAITQQQLNAGNAPNSDNLETYIADIVTSNLDQTAYKTALNDLTTNANTSHFIDTTLVADILAENADIIFYSIGGSMSGLNGSMTLQNNVSNDLTITTNGSFTLTTLLNNAETYNVTILTQPTGQTCSVTNGSGSIASSDITNILVNCVINTPDLEPTFSLSGQIFIAPLIQIDSDINDPSAAQNINNNTFDAAQAIDNFSTVHGFVTQLRTNDSNDNFGSTADPDDIFQLNLQKNQLIRLQTADFSSNNPTSIDLDLTLFDSNRNFIADSFSTTEFESISVPADGRYFIQINAFRGTSKYVLNLDNISSSNIPSNSSIKFVPNQAIIKYNINTQSKSSSINSVTIQTSNTDKRATLARFSYAAKAIAELSSFEQELSQSNPKSYAKYKTLQTIKALNQQADVDYAEPNFIRQSLATPSDPLYALQWHYSNVNLPATWDITVGARAQDVIVAVIDTGVFLAHEDLNNKLIAGYDFISNASSARDGDGIDNNPDDPGDSSLQGQSSWHGTHVAGTIGAEANNSKGGSGVSWEAKIMPLRVLGAEGGTTFDTIQAVLYAAGLANDSNTVPPQIADVINLSLGGGGSSFAEQSSFTAARDAGVIIVAAAGNENSSQLSFPAAYDGVISVSATGFDNTLAPYSNFGSTIDIAAPGGNQTVDLNNDNNADGILSSLVDDSTGIRNSSYAFYQGTSMAAPHVAGIIALMRAVHPTLSPDDLDNLIISGSITTDLGTVGKDDSFGYGLIDALKAVQQAQVLNNGGNLPSQPAIIVATPNQISLGTSLISSTITLANIGGDSAQITSVSDNASWLTIAENIVDANKLGTYSITIDKTGLQENEPYLATITFTISTGSTVDVPVSMINGATSTLGDIGILFLLLINANDNIEEQQVLSSTLNSLYDYSFTGLTQGEYTLIVGSDVDNDFVICQLGESCGAYPTLNQITPINLDSNKTNLDFTVDILSSFRSITATAQAITPPSSKLKSLPKSN